MTLGNATYQKTVRRFLGTISVYSVIDKLFGSVYIAIMSHRGLSDGHIGLVLSAGSLSLTIFDYPSGNIADTYGRRRSMIAGFLILGAGLLLHAFVGTTWGFVASMSTWALGVALISGSPQAWLVGELTRLNRPKARERILPLANTIALTTSAIAAALAGIALIRGFQWPIICAGGIALLVGVSLPWLLRENYGKRGIRLSRALLRNTRELFSRSDLRLLLLFVAAARVPFQVFVMSWQLYALRVLALPAELLGPLLAAMILILAAGSGSVLLLKKVMRQLHMSLLGFSCLLLGMATLTISKTLWAFAVSVTLIEFGLGLHQGAFSSWVHDYIEDERRASVLSALSSAGSMMGIIVPIATGQIIERVGFSGAWLMAAAATAVASVVLIRIISQARTREVTG